MKNPINEYYKLKSMKSRLHQCIVNGILNNNITKEGLICPFNYYINQEFDEKERIELLKMVEENIYIYVGKLGGKIEEKIDEKMKQNKEMIQKELGIPQYLGIDPINKKGGEIN